MPLVACICLAFVAVRVWLLDLLVFVLFIFVVFF